MFTQTESTKGFFNQQEAAEYLHTTDRKIGLYRRNKLIKYAKLGKNFLYKKEWLDQFIEDWQGYDLSNKEKMLNSIALREWRATHGTR